MSRWHFHICRNLKNCPFAVLMAIGASTGVIADELELARAEALALSQDPSVQTLYSRQSALSDFEVAAMQLPSPVLKMGVMSLPVNSFQLGQEPMTQVQLGVMQKFPRGRSRAIRAEQYREKAMAMGALATDLELKILLAVREDFVEVQKQQRLKVINQAAEEAFEDLEEITQDYYATGRVQQQDVLRAAVELARVRDRSLRISLDEQRARARLSAWVGEEANQRLNIDWPAFGGLTGAQEIKHTLPQHPRLQALQREISAAEKGVELAKQSYKPEFTLDLSYGGRGGINFDGSSRPDLLSVMVLMDIPLFQRKRQDRIASASINESSAAEFTRNDLFRRMSSEIDVNTSTLMWQNERLTLFENSLLPEALFNAESTFDAYQSSLADLTTLMRARITEFDLQLEYVRLQGEIHKTKARLSYLRGESS